MLFFSKWKITLILGALLLGFFFALPNALPSETRAKMPGMFQRTINLGLDLQGGAHMLLEVDLTSVLEQALENEKETIRQEFREADRLRTETIRVDSENDAVIVRLRDAADSDRAFTLLKEMSKPVDPQSLSQDKTTKVEKLSDKDFRVTITEANIADIQQRTIAQSMNVLRRRIDPQGTCLLYTSPSPRDGLLSRMPSSA